MLKYEYGNVIDDMLKVKNGFDRGGCVFLFDRVSIGFVFVCTSFEDYLVFMESEDVYFFDKLIEPPDEKTLGHANMLL